MTDVSKNLWIVCGGCSGLGLHGEGGDCDRCGGIGFTVLPHRATSLQQAMPWARPARARAVDAKRSRMLLERV